MSLSRLLRLIRHRWPVLVIGMLLTVGLAAYTGQGRDVYYARTALVFMAPSSTIYPNSLQTRSEDLIITAGAVAKRVMGPAAAQKYASPDANLAGIPDTGLDYWLRLPDTGGQWAPNFAEQLLYLDVIGASPDDVRDTQSDVVARAHEELDALQRAQGVNPVNDITFTVAPEVAVIEQVHGSRVRALAMTAVLGLTATVAAIVALELLAGRRRRRAFEVDRLSPYAMTMPSR
jgi:hypothetical protein